ncbi:MAG: GAF domain-containing protein [Halanaerobiales bacterium]|nr:GAF domain-containing protein [Halanaerobiales bacterium]
MQALIEGESDWLANMANLSALLYHNLENVNWVGFYLMKDGELVLGPFQGKPACIRIEVGLGVCGSAVKDKRTYIVGDVHQFEGHIACDQYSRSEIVVPLFYQKQIIGVLDIDSPLTNNFDQIDKKYLEKMVNDLIKNSMIKSY